MTSRVDKAREIVGHPLTLTEKILYNHLWDGMPSKTLQEELIMLIFQTELLVKMQRLKWLLQFMHAGKAQVAVPTTVHCDHLIQAKVDAVTDLQSKQNNEVLIFFHQCLINTDWFLETGAGIIHQVVLENYAFPGGMMIGTDSHCKCRWFRNGGYWCWWCRCSGCNVRNGMGIKIP
jgi:aconitate hydratase